MAALRVGVWGVGAWGEKHARVWRELSAAGHGVELVGLYDVKPERARTIAEAEGCRAFESPAALLAEVEALSVTTPTTAHRSATETALAAGVHVLVEKPMA